MRIRLPPRQRKEMREEAGKSDQRILAGAGGAGQAMMTVLPRAPTSSRDIGARLVGPRPSSWSAFSMPSYRRQEAGRIACGVTSSGVGPVPPVKTISEAAPKSACFSTACWIVSV